MNVLWVSGSLPQVQCGIGDYSGVVAQGLAREAGMSVEILTTGNPVVDPPAASPAVVVPWSRGWRLGALPRLRAEIVRRRPDVVHVQYPAVGYGRGLGIVLLPLALRVRRLPVVLTIHERRERGRASRLAIDTMAIASNRVIVLDPIEAADLRAHVPLIGDKIALGEMVSTIPIHPRIDRDAVRRELGAGPSDLVIATFGLLHPRRRVEVIVEALRVLLQRGMNGRLLVMGGEAQYDLDRARLYVRDLRASITDPNLAARVDWLGHVDAARLSTCLQASDVVVLLYPTGASRRNTTLRAALEHGLPIVTTDGPATSSELRAEAGLTFVDPAVDAQGLTEAILRASAAPRRAVGGEYPSNLAHHVEFHLGLYRELARPASVTSRRSA